MGFSPFFFHSGDSFGILMDSLGLQCNFHGSFGIVKDSLGCSAIVKDHFMLIPSRNQRTFELLGEGGGDFVGFEVSLDPFLQDSLGSLWIL